MMTIPDVDGDSSEDDGEGGDTGEDEDA